MKMVSIMTIEDLTGRTAAQISELFQMQEPDYTPQEAEVGGIISKVRADGDRALVSLTRQFDGVSISSGQLAVSMKEADRAAEGFDPALYKALETSVERVYDFHRRIRPEHWSYVDKLGNRLGQRATPLKRVGIYVPGGKAAYPSTLIMTAVPALAAGVEEIAMVSPPASFERPSALSAALRSIRERAPENTRFEAYRVGGVQAVAALALGTESIERVDKIVGPGNRYVTIAKKLLFGRVDIDMLAGPSEVLIIADGSVDARVTAADLLAQAEHDEDARAICVTHDRETAQGIATWAGRLAAESPRRAIAEESLKRNGRVYLVKDLDAAVAVANLAAPEHLELQTADPQAMLPSIRNAGAVFLGRFTPEAFGDYLAGPSHVLPTGGTARFFSPLSTAGFMKFSSVVDMSEKGMTSLAEDARVIAEHEGLHAHALSITARLESGDGQSPRRKSSRPGHGQPGPGQPDAGNGRKPGGKGT
jgi:histidinol dehydrogenase